MESKKPINNQAIMENNDNNKGLMTYEVSGEQVTLSRTIVRNFLTRGNSSVSDAEIVQFMSLCRANRLNPFIGDAYLVKYDKSPAQMIVSKDAFLKRGEESGVCTGYRAGVIVVREGKILFEQGSFFLPSDQLVGGWCEVSRRDRKAPIVARVRLAEYNKGKSTWAAMPGTMIRKVAIAQAFREAFPMQLGHMYLPEEGPDDQEQRKGEVNNTPAVFSEPEPKDTPVPEDDITDDAPDFEPDQEPAYDADPVPEDMPEPVENVKELNEDFFNV